MSYKEKLEEKINDKTKNSSLEMPVKRIMAPY